MAKKLGLQPVERVTAIDLQRCDGVSDADLETVTRFSELLVLHVWYLDFHRWNPHEAKSKITDAGIEKLRAHPGLLALNLAGAEITDEGLKHIGDLRQLRRLGLYGMPNVTKRGIAHLQPLSQLESLSLHDCSVSNLEQGFLSPNCALTNLWLRDTKLTDAGLEVVAKIKSIRELDLGRTAVTDEGMKALENLPLLEKLNLYDMQITDKGLASLVKLPLVDLYLGKTAISKEGLELLVQIPTLHTLVLDNSNLGVEAIPILCKMQKLEYLGLNGTRIKSADIAPLQTKFPNAQIDTDTP